MLRAKRIRVKALRVGLECAWRLIETMHGGGGSVLREIDRLQNETCVQQMRALLRRRRLVPYVGAGMSVCAGYPLLNTFIADISHATGLAPLPGRTSFHAFLKHVKQQLAEDMFRKYVDRTFGADRIPHKQLDGAITLLPRLQPELILTANYDCLLEHVFGDRLSVETSHTFDGLVYQVFQLSALDAARPLLIKLHGSVGRAEGFVLTSDEYERAYRHPGKTKQLLSRLFTSHSCLFLGSSLQPDDAPVMVLSALRRRLGVFAQQHYAVRPSPPTEQLRIEEQDRLTGLNVNVVWYQDADHDAAIAEILESLAAAFDRPLAPSPATGAVVSSVSLPFSPLRHLAESGASARANRNGHIWSGTLAQLAQLASLDDLVIDRAPDVDGQASGALLVRTARGRLSPGETTEVLVPPAWGPKNLAYLLPRREFRNHAIRAFGLEVDAERSTVVLRLYDEPLLTVRVQASN